MTANKLSDQNRSRDSVSQAYHPTTSDDSELEWVRRHLPTAERVLGWYAAYVDAHGTISDVPEWNLVDRASIFLSGRSSILTGLWARGLAEFAEMSHAVGQPGAAARARGLHAAAAEGFEDFWDQARGLYVDHIVDGARRPAASQLANAAAIVSGLAPNNGRPPSPTP
jgi:alpha-L-rhamnosidase